MRKVLLTGAGAPGGPGIIQALLKAGYELTTGDCNPKASGRFLHDHFIQLPYATDADFIPFLTNYCRNEKIDVLLPLVTKELMVLARHRKHFKDAGTTIVVSDSDSLHIANDKGLLYLHLQSNNVPVPTFFVANAVEELFNAATVLGYPQVPVCIKPCNSNGSRGVRILSEKIDDYDLLFHHKPNHLYSTLEKIGEMLAGRSFPALLVSEYLPGEEYTVDCIVQNGNPCLVLPRSREKMNNGISIQGTFQKNEEIITYCKQILATLELSGPIGLQVKQNKDGVYRLLEINPRLQGTSVAAMGMGVNLPALAIEQAFGDVIIDVDSLPWGTSFVRYYQEAFFH